MARQNGFAVAYGVCNNGSAGTIQDAVPQDFYIASMVQGIVMRSEASDVQAYKDCDGVLRTKVLGGSKRTCTITLIPTSGASGAAQIALAEDEVKLPADGAVLTLAGFKGATDASGEINGDWIYEGNGTITLSNEDAAQVEVELVQYYDDAGVVVNLEETT